jgi:hypothetical protein
MYSLTTPEVCNVIDQLNPELLDALKQRIIEQIA